MHCQIFNCFLVLSGFFLNANPTPSSQKTQSVFITDIRKEMLNPNTIAPIKYYFFNNSEIPSLSANDSIQIQKTQSDASRVTFEKITLESVGAITGGLCAYGITSFLFQNIGGGFWKGLMTIVDVPLGIAGGTTFMGNLVMEPNGSFGRSLMGTVKGAILGQPVAMLAGLSGTGGTIDNITWNPKPITYILFGIAAVFPVTGAVIGYNKVRTGCFLLGKKDSEDQKILNTYFNTLSVKVQLISISF